MFLNLRIYVSGLLVFKKNAYHRKKIMFDVFVNSVLMDSSQIVHLEHLKLYSDLLDN